MVLSYKNRVYFFLADLKLKGSMDGDSKHACPDNLSLKVKENKREEKKEKKLMERTEFSTYICVHIYIYPKDHNRENAERQ